MALPARLLPADRDRAAAERDSLPLISGSPVFNTAASEDGEVEATKGAVIIEWQRGPRLPDGPPVGLLCKVPATVVKEEVALFGQSSLHHPDAAVEETLKLGGVQDLLPLLLGQFPLQWKGAWRNEQKACEEVTGVHLDETPLGGSRFGRLHTRVNDILGSPGPPHLAASIFPWLLTHADRARSIQHSPAEGRMRPGPELVTDYGGRAASTECHPGLAPTQTHIFKTSHHATPRHAPSPAARP
ncbi:hypothetical protein EYF80_017598 [Liparis tanakae]|uniref:Uncharacterized protein n=1 Tax=Liparis tanakae TaxID=230148 RepID=A0A4Z2I2W6_9TELE|nr:hypothetical protein EYF80_017598 [Liparis tanakae]